MVMLNIEHHVLFAKFFSLHPLLAILFIYVFENRARDCLLRRGFIYLLVGGIWNETMLCFHNRKKQHLVSVPSPVT